MSVGRDEFSEAGENGSYGRAKLRVIIPALSTNGFKIGLARPKVTSMLERNPGSLLVENGENGLELIQAFEWSSSDNQLLKGVS